MTACFVTHHHTVFISPALDNALFHFNTPVVMPPTQPLPNIKVTNNPNLHELYRDVQITLSFVFE